MLTFFSLASRKTQVYYFVNLSSVQKKHQGKFWTKGEFERATIAPPKVCFQISLHQVDSTGFWREDFYFIFLRLHFWVLLGGWISRCPSQFCCANSALHASHSRTWRSDSAPLQKIPCPPDFLPFVPVGFWLRLSVNFTTTGKSQRFQSFANTNRWHLSLTTFKVKDTRTGHQGSRIVPESCCLLFLETETSLDWLTTELCILNLNRNHWALLSI